jgi:hypothetical protein
MSEMVVKILVQLISTLAHAIKQIKQGRLSEPNVVNKSLGLDLMIRREVRKEAFRRQ